MSIFKSVNVLTNMPNTLSSGSITTSVAGVGNTVSLALGGHKSCAVTVSGIWTGTLVVESSTDDGVTWVRSWLQSIAAATVYEVLQAVDSFTQNGAYSVFLVAGITHYRVRATTDTAWTGLAAVKLAATEVAGALFTSTSMIQNVLASSGNSSTTTLNPATGSGYIFTGIPVSTLGVAGIQVSLYTNQNCTVYVEQSPDASNWDIIDQYSYRYQTHPNFGKTIQAVNSYARVRVENLSTVASASNFRLQTCLCPIVEALPRSLSAEGNLKVGVYEIEDDTGTKVKLSPQGALRTTNAVRLCGVTFYGTTIDTSYWTPASGSGGTCVQTGGQFELKTNTTATGSASLQSVRTARYMNGSANFCRIIADYGGVGVVNNIKRWGAFTGTMNAPTDGAMFELIDAVPTIATYKGGVATRIYNGSFNGQYGAALNAIPPGAQTFEIIYTNKTVLFMFNDLLAHRVDATAATWASTLSLPLRAENVNTSGSVTDTSLKIRSFSTYRYGEPISRPQWRHQANAVAGVVLKQGPGSLQRVINNDNVGSLALYDALTATNAIAIIDLTKAVGGSIEYNLDFYTGLTYTTTGACDVTIVFE